MRKVMALVVLFCSAASAYAAAPAPTRYCSGGDILRWSDGQKMLVGSEQWEYVGPVGDGISVSLGTDYKNGTQTSRLRSTTVRMENGEVGILIFRDRVFWPCDFRHVR